jgi:hypothetical protein
VIPALERLGQWNYTFEVSLGYTASSRLALATQRDCLKNQIKTIIINKNKILQSSFAHLKKIVSYILLFSF